MRVQRPETGQTAPLLHSERERNCCRSCCSRIMNIWTWCSEAYLVRFAASIAGPIGIGFGPLLIATGWDPLAGGILLGVGTLSFCCLTPYLAKRCANGEDVLGDCCRGMFWRWPADPPVPVTIV